MEFLISTKSGTYTVPDFLERAIEIVGGKRSQAVAHVASIAGVARTAIYRWLKDGNKRPPSAEALEKIERQIFNEPSRFQG